MKRAKVNASKTDVKFNPRFNYPPPTRTLGFDLIDAGNGSATIEIVTDVARHANPMGTVHGGVLCDVADAAIGTAHAIFSVLCGTTGFERLPSRCIEGIRSADMSATFLGSAQQ